MARGTKVWKNGQYHGVFDRPKKPRPDNPDVLMRNQKWIALGPDEREADDKLDALIHAHKRGAFVEPSKKTLGDWLGEWIKKRANTGKFAFGTIELYRSTVRQIQQSELGNIPVQRLRLSDIDDYIAELVAKGLAPSTVRSKLAMLRVALEKARKDELVAANVTLDAERPARSTENNAEARVHCWTKDEAKAFIATADAKGPQAAAFYALALDTGARISELGGLTWDHFKADRCRVDIVQQLHRRPLMKSKTTGLRHPLFAPTKTKTSRSIVLAKETVARLLAHKKAQAEARLAAGKGYQNNGLIFATRKGGPLRLCSLPKREFAVLIELAGVKPIRFHGIRHTCATLLLLGGQPIQNVSKRLGHATVSMTLNVYVHVLEELAGVDAPTGAILYG